MLERYLKWDQKENKIGSLFHVHKKEKKAKTNKQPKQNKMLGECFPKIIARNAWQNVPKEEVPWWLSC